MAGDSVRARRLGHGFRSLLLQRCALEALESRVLLSSDILTNHGGGGGTGLVSNETVLTPANVASSLSNSTTTNFGRLFDTTLDGQVFAQVLAKANVNITRGSSPGIHDVLYVATEHDSLYAVDANTGGILWQDNFTQIVNPQVTTVGTPVPTAGVTTIPVADLLSSLVSPELGILSTPVIDPATNILYVLANSMELRNGSTPAAAGADRHFVQRLWAINISSGAVAITASNPAAEPAAGGVIVGDTIKNDTISTSNYLNYQYVAGPYVKGTGNNDPTGVSGVPNADGWTVNSADTSSVFAGTTPSAQHDIAFNALIQMGRLSATLVNGEVFLGFASHGDNGPYYGWLLGFSATTLANNIAFITVPNFEPFSVVSGDRAAFIAQAGFWNSGASVSTDGTYLYISTGNGAFNPNPSNFSASYTSTDHGNTVQMPLDDDYGDAVLKLQIDLNATQSNVNYFSGVLHNPNGTYDPDGGYNADGYGLKVVDYFTPSNVFELNLGDEDMSSGGVTLIPSTGPGSATAPNGDPMLVTAGKEGRIYLIDANNLGGFNTQYVVDGNEMTSNDPAPYDRVLGEYYYYEANGHPTVKANTEDDSFSFPAYFNGEFYIGISSDPELGFNVTATTPNFFFTSAVPRTGVEPAPNFTSAAFGNRGTSATITSNGLSSGIIWNINEDGSSSDALTAYSTTGTLLFSSAWKINGAANATSDTLQNGVSGATGPKFGLPTAFNGMIYAGSGGTSGGKGLGSVVGYGLLGSYLSNNSLLLAPSNLTTLRTGSGVQLNWARHSVSETVTEIDRSTNGTNWSVLTNVSNGANSYIDASANFPTQYFYRVRAVSGLTLAVFTNSATAPAVVSGDANVDGSVDLTDLSIVLNNFGSAASNWTNGNFDGAGTVDLTDLSDVLNNFGSSSVIAGAVVPDAGDASVGVPDVAAPPVTAITVDSVTPISVDPVTTVAVDPVTVGSLPVDTTPVAPAVNPPMAVDVPSAPAPASLPVTAVAPTPPASRVPPAAKPSKKPVNAVKASKPVTHAPPLKHVMYLGHGRWW